MEGHCQPECVCVRPGEVPDQDGICRGISSIWATKVTLSVGCGPNPCHHNGTCRIQGSRQVCECVDGYDGALCENGSCSPLLYYHPLSVKNLCLEEQPALCPTGAYECVMNGVNNYTCYCAAGYFPDKNNHCVKVSHSVKVEMHFTETPYSEVYNDPAKKDYKEVREIIQVPVGPSSPPFYSSLPRSSICSGTDSSPWNSRTSPKVPW